MRIKAQFQVSGTFTSGFGNTLWRLVHDIQLQIKNKLLCCNLHFKTSPWIKSKRFCSTGTLALLSTEGKKWLSYRWEGQAAREGARGRGGERGGTYVRRAGTLSVASLQHGARSGLLRQGTVEEVALNYSLKKTVFFFFLGAGEWNFWKDWSRYGDDFSSFRNCIIFILFFFLVSILHWRVLWGRDCFGVRPRGAGEPGGRQNLLQS